MLRSSFSCRFSRRNRTSSSRSAAVRPGFAAGSLAPRRFSLRSASATQFRIACADGSNSWARSLGSRPARTSSTICRRNSAGYGGRVLGIGKTRHAKAFSVSTCMGLLMSSHEATPLLCSLSVCWSASSKGVVESVLRSRRPRPGDGLDLAAQLNDPRGTRHLARTSRHELVFGRTSRDP